MKKILLCLPLCLSGCAYNANPRVDLEAGTEQQYQQDLLACRDIAEQVDKAEAVRVSAGNEAALTALDFGGEMALEEGTAGAVAGSLSGALVGGLAGIVRGASRANRDKTLVLNNCLRHRGYTVLSKP
ncbi:hypothetical protein [Ferrimonas marina]|uniref:Glycine zipper family protein n=1 Tax=Ferrimonas marina TaxID=299255 RepID=A0A1M5ZLA9_9GAMM|nr:hypothetical protein [Ferrimonas marina]SHI24928.1 hypothetical protein SAMN02745129_0394 [Ferrimonas marina]